LFPYTTLFRSPAVVIGYREPELIAEGLADRIAGLTQPKRVLPKAQESFAVRALRPIVDDPHPQEIAVEISFLCDVGHIQDDETVGSRLEGLAAGFWRGAKVFLSGFPCRHTCFR